MKKTIAQVGFTLFLVMFAAILLYLTLELGPAARLVPLKVVIPTLALLSIQLALDLAPPLARRFGRIEKVRFVRSERLQEKARAFSGAGRTGTSRVYREGSMLVWISLILCLIYLLGLEIAFPLFTFLFLKARSREGWLVSLGMSAGIWVLVHGVFILALRIRLYEGILWSMAG